MSKNKLSSLAVIPHDALEQRIYLIRGKRVMLDRDLAKLYGISTKILNQSVKRNLARFPEDFMFQFTGEELDFWRSQIVTSKSEKRGLRYPPYAFTEQGVAMLSSVLKSPRAIDVNIQIMRTFVRMREWMASHAELEKKIEELTKEMREKFGIHDEQFKIVFKAFEQVKKVLVPPAKRRGKIGFH